MILLALLACRPDLAWSDCDGDFECATLQREDAEIAVVRHVGREKDARVIVLADGGPGASSIALLETLIDAWGDDDEELWLDPTWVAMDNRGVGQTDALDCVGDDWFDDVRSRDPVPATDAEADALRASAEAFVSGCLDDRSADELGALGTPTYADDLDAFRIALDVETLDLLGFSAGSLVGATFVARHPGSVGRVVLDGVVGPEATRDTFLTGQAAGMELALERSFARCEDDPECPLSRPGATWDALLDEATETPLAAPSDPAGRRATRNELRWAATSLMYGPDDATLAEALAEAEGGDAGAILAAADDGWGIDPESGHYASIYQGYWGIGCLDAPWPEGWTDDDVWELGRQLDRDYPRVGANLLTGELNCLDWPVRAAPTDFSAPDAPPVLLVNGRYDPATPYASAEAMAEALDNGSTVLPYEGDGHVAMFSDASGCSYLAERAFLLEGDAGTDVCP